jgi:A/G-specific adenine glycosylase
LGQVVKPMSPHHLQRALLESSLLGWYDREHHKTPWRLKWQSTQDPYVVWISEIMLQQTVMKVVLPRYESFIERYPNILALAAASSEELQLAVRGLGYYRRFRMLHQAVKKLSEGVQQLEAISWPTSRAQWQELDGVGPYVSAALASITLGESVAVVDGNVERVLARLLDLQVAVNDKSLKKTVQSVAEQVVSRERAGDFNQALMELGQRICTPFSPLCEDCPVKTQCLAFERKTQHLAPRPRIKPDPIKVLMKLCVAYDPKTRQVLLLERPATSKFLKGIYGFMTLMNNNGRWELDGLPAIEIQERSLQDKTGNFKHSITKHKIMAEAVMLKAQQVQKLAQNNAIPFKWCSVESVEQQLISNLDRKALALALKSFVDH